MNEQLLNQIKKLKNEMFYTPENFGELIGSIETLSGSEKRVAYLTFFQLINLIAEKCNE